MMTTMISSLASWLNTLAWRPFLDPLPIDDVWLVLLIPMVVAIAVVYKTIKTENLKTLAKESAYLSFQIGLFMVVAAGVLWAITSVV